MYFNCRGCYVGVPFSFVEITNYTNESIYFVLQYDSQKGRKTKQSSVLQRDMSEKITFTRNAQNIAINVVNSMTGHVICNIALESTKNHYFYVIETPSGPECVQK